MTGVPDRKFPEVVEAARRGMAAEGRLESWRAYWVVSAQLGGTEISDKFSTQVKRALDKLAADGELVKVNRGARLPSGGYASNPVYFTPAAFEAAMEKHRIEEEHKAAIKARWQAVHDQLAARGITNNDPPGTGVTLALPVWETLLKEGKL